MNSTAPLWKPSDVLVRQARITAFTAFVNAQRDGTPDLHDWPALHAWSVSSPEAFWTALWEFADIRAEVRGDRVLEQAQLMPGARWYPDARLNFADNLLRQEGDGDAIVFRSEDGRTSRLSHGELTREVERVAGGLAAAGVQVGDRVAGFLPNLPEAVIAMLATARIGAVWSSCSPDFGINGVRDRFGQIAPKVLFTADGYCYAGKTHDCLATVNTLVESLPDLVRVVVIEYAGGTALQGRAQELAGTFESFGRVSGGASDAAAISEAPAPLMLPFDHPLYILFSSGTTGKPKCIVHGAGGTLLQHVKEHQLHADVRAGDRVFFFTTCGWMMWNWLVSALASGATLMLYDGSPFHPDGNVLFDYAATEGITQFGTSAKFIDACNKAGLSPRRTHDLASLRSVMSTGSPLLPESFDYVYEHIGKDLCLSSMSGGTDIVSCFALGNPTLPVYRGELQCLGLGLDVQACDDAGKPLPVGEKGELVCAQPFPCMPTGFFDDADGSRYRAAYFERFPGVWCHGDYVAMTEHGGMIIYGRSDAVLNPGGVRIGTAEIYRQVEAFEEVIESLVIGQSWEGDVRVVLFVRLREGLELDAALIERIRAHVRAQTTPRHVPARIVQVSDIPRTRSGKIVELAVRRVVQGEPVTNVEALANPEALALFRDLPELQV